MKVKIIVYQGKSYIIAKRNVLALFRNKQIQLYKLYASFAREVGVKNRILHHAKRNEIHGVG